MKRWRAIAQIGVPVFWAGLVVGLSFIETPLKFRAPGITRELGLGIGRLVFSVLGRVEHVLAVLLVLLWFKSSRFGARACLWSVVLIVLAQAIWLLPALDAQAVSIILGAARSGSYHHRLFVVLEVAKVCALFGLASQHRLFAEAGSRSQPPPEPHRLTRGRTETHRYR
jgi:hypothetical protein